MGGDEGQALIFCLEALLRTDIGQMRLDVVCRDSVEVEALDTREDRLRNLLGVGRAEDEHDMLRRLFERLQQRIEGCRREHVDLVDDVDLVGAHGRREAHTVDDLLAHVVHARAACRIELIDIRVLPCRDEAALLACAIGKLAWPLLAHEGLGQDPCHRRLAGASGAAEEIGMRDPAFEHSMLERRYHMLLSDDILEGQGPVFSVERFHLVSWREGMCSVQYTRAPV